MNQLKTFEINWKKLVFQLLPSSLRSKRLFAFGCAALGNVAAMDDHMETYMKSVVYRLSHTPKKIHIRKVLNDHFDKQARRIQINNVRNTEPIWFAKHKDEKPVWFARRTKAEPVYTRLVFFRPSDYREDDSDFVVLIPNALRPVHEADLQNFIGQVKGQIDYYKEPDKKYRIDYYEKTDKIYCIS